MQDLRLPFVGHHLLKVIRANDFYCKRPWLEFLALHLVYAQGRGGLIWRAGVEPPEAFVHDTVRALAEFVAQDILVVKRILTGFLVRAVEVLSLVFYESLAVCCERQTQVALESRRWPLHFRPGKQTLGFRLFD